MACDRMTAMAGPSSTSAPDRDNLATILPAHLLAAWPLAEWDGVHVVVAVSGGADSMALLHALRAAKQGGRGAGRLFAVHVNHKLRCAESDADATWLRQQCEQLGVPLIVHEGDTAALAATEGDGIEAAARALRYELLAEAAHKLGARYVATAHTRDDQVETVLFRLLRGSGLRGLAGIPRRRPLSPAITLVRPLLDCTRDDVVAFLESIGQSWRNDSSNRATAFARNRIRHELLPLAREAVNGDVDAAIARAAEQAGDARDVIDSLVDELLTRCREGTATGEQFRLRTAPLAGQPTLLAAEIIRRAFREVGWGEQAMTYSHWRELAALALGDASKSVNLPGNRRAHREGDFLDFQAEAGCER
jgi:tRNA(Ile)-lysidine synthase